MGEVAAVSLYNLKVSVLWALLFAVWSEEVRGRWTQLRHMRETSNNNSTLVLPSQQLFADADPSAALPSFSRSETNRKR
jgi:hypothetical protein